MRLRYLDMVMYSITFTGYEAQKEKEHEEALAKMDVPPTPINSAIEVVGADSHNQPKTQLMVPLSGITFSVALFL